MNVGIDVSSNNGGIDWAQVGQAGFTFAYARATLGKESNDETFEANRQGAKAHGIRFGTYHLPYPGNSSAKQQAEHFLRVAKPRAGDLLPAIDIENKTPKDEGEAKFSRDDLVAWFRQWLAAVEAKVGAKPIIYTNPSLVELPPTERGSERPPALARALHRGKADDPPPMEGICDLAAQRSRPYWWSQIRLQPMPEPRRGDDRSFSAIVARSRRTRAGGGAAQPAAESMPEKRLPRR